MVDFKTLKKSSANLDRLSAEINKINNPQSSFEEDTRFWQPEVDKAGNGYAVIRFLPAPEVDGDDALPFVRRWVHSFKGPTGKWYIENSLTTLGQKDPASEANTLLWNTGSESNKAIVRERKRKLQYISNIMVIKDAKHPENEGKVFLYRYGKKIFDKINEAMNPDIDEEGNPIPGNEELKAVNPFDLWKGSNFHLRIRTVEKYRNYDKAEFEKEGSGQVIASPLSKDDKELEKIWKSEYSLKDFVSPDKFKSYDVLKARFEEVLGTSTSGKTTGRAQKLSEVEKAIDDVFEDTVTENSVEANDEDLEFFKQLADE